MLAFRLRKPAGASMSLRFRLSSLVCVVLVLSLALGGLVAYGNAVRSVRTEMRAALLVGRQTIETGIERLRAVDPEARILMLTWPKAAACRKSPIPSASARRQRPPAAAASRPSAAPPRPPT